MLKFLNNLLQEENIWQSEAVNDIEIKCDDEKLIRYIRKLEEIIKKQTQILKKIYKSIKEYEKNLSTKEATTQTDSENEVGVSGLKHETELMSSWKTEYKSVEEMVKEVAENAMKQTGFVYESTSGLYYDYSSGYYYNAELGLYYDGRTGTYYYYDKERNIYQFHSQVEFPVSAATEVTGAESENSASAKPKKRKEKSKNKRKTNKKLKKKENCDMEEGECSEESNQASDISSVEDFDDDCVVIDENLNSNIFREHYNNNANDASLTEMSKAWPPCMRIIIKETNVKSLQVGSLFIITYAGGTIGRAGEHAILIPDINTSKYHAKFSFDTEDEKNEIGHYTLTDLGSRNGTFVDGKRLSTALQESEPCPVSHDSNIRIGGTILLCHIHAGRETCSQCEPGLLISERDEKRSAYVLEENISEKRKKQLKKLKQKFGLNSGGDGTTTACTEYKDRAEIRRQTVGSHSDSFKTETASVCQPIKQTNKGFKMLSKMGWSEGESLGSKSEDGIKEPILVQQRAEKVGLGYDKPLDVELDETIKKKQELWKKVQDRYKSLE